MIERLTLNWHERNVKAVAIKADTPMSLVRKLQDCLCKLLEDGEANRDNFRYSTRSTEMEVAREDLAQALGRPLAHGRSEQILASFNLDQEPISHDPKQTVCDQ